MIIELAGLPGSGKTTLAQTLAKQAGLSVLTLSYLEGVVFSALFLLLYPLASWRLWRLLVQGANGNKVLEGMLIKNALLNEAVTYEFALSKPMRNFFFRFFNRYYFSRRDS